MSQTVIAAFTLEDLERVSGYNPPSHIATFARKKGAKDKKKRMTRKGMAAVGAGAIGALGAAGAAARYGGAAIAKRRPMNSDQTFAERVKNARGARGVAKQDLAKAKQTGGRLLDSLKRAGGAGKAGLMTPSGVGGTNAGKLREPLNRLGNAAKGLTSTKAGKAGAALAGAAALGGAAVAGSKLLRRKKGKK
jgi:hypothetical protein